MKTKNRSRDTIVKLLLPVLLLAGGVLLAACSVMDSRQTAVSDKKPVAAKYVILLIGDGMQQAHEIAASRYLTGKDKALAQHAFPYKSACTHWDITTYNRYAWASGKPKYDAETFTATVGYDTSAGGNWTYDTDWDPPSEEYFLKPLDRWGGGFPGIPATDSAAAGTALATGTKTDAGNLSWSAGDPTDGALATIAEKIRSQKSASFGVVSTVPFSHATPACFVSHNVHRRNYSSEKFIKNYEGPPWISEEIIRDTKPDVVIGAGHPDFGSSGYISSTDLTGLRASASSPYDEYVFVERRTGQDGAENLSEAVSAITGSDDENHSKKLFGLFGGKYGFMEHPVPADTPGNPSFKYEPENPTLAQCTHAALQVLELRGKGNGFFLMVEGGDIDWANHSNHYSWLIGSMHQLDEAVKAVVSYVDDTGNDLSWSNTLVIVTSDHSNSYMRLSREPAKILSKGDLPLQNKTNPPTYPDGEVWYKTRSHTSEPVMIYARGAGAELFKEYEGKWYPGTRLIDNTHINRVMSRALGVR